MDFPPFIPASAVAQLTGYDSAAAFLKDRGRLEDHQGFPAPMPTCLRPLKWRRDAVQAWVDALPASDPLAPTLAQGDNIVAFPVRA